MIKQYKKTYHAIEMYEDTFPKGKYKKKINRIIRSKLKKRLEKILKSLGLK